MSLISKIQSLISSANAVTGESRTDLTSAVQDLKDGYEGGDLDFEGGSTIVKSLIVTIGANNCTTMPECGAYIASLCNLDSSYKISLIAIEKKNSYINREFGQASGRIVSPYDSAGYWEYIRWGGSRFSQTNYSYSYDGFLIEGTKYLVILTKEAE